MKYTSITLVKMWDDNLRLHGQQGIMVIPVDTGSGLGWSLGLSTVFLPLYLTSVFHKCLNCGACCKAFGSKLARGVELTRDEAQALQLFCRITKRSGKYLLKYPCVLQKNQKCTQYKHRPFCCRAFPIVSETGAGLSASLSVFMTCPAGKDTYVTASLFLQELRQLLRSAGRFDREFSFADLEQLKTKFNPNTVSLEDMDYIKEKAQEMGLR